MRTWLVVGLASVRHSVLSRSSASSVMVIIHGTFLNFLRATWLGAQLKCVAATFTIGRQPYGPGLCKWSRHRGAPLLVAERLLFRGPASLPTSSPPRARARKQESCVTVLGASANAANPGEQPFACGV